MDGGGEDMWDLSDQFVAEAFSGGLLTLTLIRRHDFALL